MRSSGLLLVISLVALTGCTPDAMVERADQRVEANNAANNATNNASNNGTDAAALRGAELYNLYCVACHGAEGLGAPVWPGNIQGIDPIHGIVKNGQGDMPPVPIEDGQISDIQAYLNSLVETGNNTLPLTGLQVYQNTCAPCHGAEGQGAPKGPMIQFTFRPYARWVTRNGRAGVGFPGPMTAYDTDRVSDAHLEEILDYLHAQTRPTTGEALHNTFCANCHGKDGQDGPAAETLAGRLESSLQEVREGNGGNNYGARLAYMPRWTAAELSDDEVAAIDAYIETLPAP